MRPYIEDIIIIAIWAASIPALLWLGAALGYVR